MITDTFILVFLKEDVLRDLSKDFTSDLGSPHTEYDYETDSDFGDDEDDEDEPTGASQVEKPVIVEDSEDSGPGAPTVCCIIHHR